MPRVAFSMPQLEVEEEETPSIITPPPCDDGVLLSQRSESSTGSAGIHRSHRSEGSAGSGSSRSFKSPSLRGNLTRQHKDRDPLAYYEITQLLGTGSMGSVAKVRKKLHAVGGSARYNMQERRKVHRKVQACFSLPLVGGLFSHCLKGKADAWLERASLHPTDSGIAASSKEASTSVSTMTDSSSRSGGGRSSSGELIFAMKSIHLKHISDQTFVEELKNEIEILKSLDHAHIVRVIETFDHGNQLFVIMELCSGGDLYSRDPYTEEQAARIVSAILSAVAYMHNKGVLHRDLKYENILFVNDTPQAEIKLIDFGLSRAFVDHEELTEGVGTIYTMAPEVLNGKYTKSADLWSIGVIAYMLLSSQMPFYGSKRGDVIKQIMSGKYQYKGRRWKRVSAQAKAFVDDLLEMDADDRATADEALRASWLNRRHTATVRNPLSEEIDNVKRSIKRFAGYSKLRKVALMVVAHRSTTQEIGILRKVFQQYDIDGSGTINYEEFKAALHDVGFTDENYRDLFDEIDIDGSGVIRYTEFLAATLESMGPISEERLAEAFDRVDHDDSGYISKGNLRYLLGPDFPQEEIDAIVNEAASENGMGISYSEFLAQWGDDEETLRQNRMIEEVVVLKNNDFHNRNVSADQISVLTSEGSDSEDIARVNFLERKGLSERKLSESSEPPKLSPEKGSPRKVLFQGDALSTPREEETAA